MNKFISFLLLMVSAVVMSACAQLPANTTDMDRLGSRIERALEANRPPAPPIVVAPPASNGYERTETVSVVEGEQLPDGSTSKTTTKRLVVKGDLWFGANDPLFRDTTGSEPLLRLRGPNGGTPPFFTAPGDTVSPTPEQRRRLLGIK